MFGSICLDISKTFDCVDHEKLYNKLSSCGIAEDVLCSEIILIDRTQEVKIGDIKSKCKSINTGIGLGMILGPLIFNFNINDVIKILLSYV